MTGQCRGLPSTQKRNGMSVSLYELEISENGPISEGSSVLWWACEGRFYCNAEPVFNLHRMDWILVNGFEIDGTKNGLFIVTLPLNR